jgi:hypothetical protein
MDIRFFYGIVSIQTHWKLVKEKVMKEMVDFLCLSCFANYGCHELFLSMPTCPLVQPKKFLSFNAKSYHI